MEHASLYKPVGCNQKQGSTPLSIFIVSQTLKSKKASQSYLSVHFCIPHSIPPIHFIIKSYHLYLCHHPNFRGAFRYFNINSKTFKNKLIPLKCQFVVAKKINILTTLHHLENLIKLFSPYQSKVSTRAIEVCLREPVSRSS